MAGTDGVARPVVCRQGPVLVAAFHPELSGDSGCTSCSSTLSCLLMQHDGCVEESSVACPDIRKWATIKHKKGAADKARGKLFAKLIRQVEVAAREGGGDPDANPTLRTHVPEGPGVVGAARHHRAGHQAGHRRARRASATSRSPTRATPRAGWR